MNKFILAIISFLMVGSNWFPFNINWWGTNNIVEEQEEPEEVIYEAVEITKAKYTHKNQYAPSSSFRLDITWEEVADAKNYDVEITKANGESKIYNVKTAYLVVQTKTANDSFLPGCPTVYIESESAWRQATVRVRVNYQNGDIGPWSEPEKITCNSLHFNK